MLFIRFNISKVNVNVDVITLQHSVWKRGTLERCAKLRPPPPTTPRRPGPQASSTVHRSQSCHSLPGEVIEPQLGFASWRQLYLHAAVNERILAQTHKVLFGANVCSAFQETDPIMDVYALPSHYAPSCRSWRSLYSFSFLIPADCGTITRRGKERRRHYGPFTDECL